MKRRKQLLIIGLLGLVITGCGRQTMPSETLKTEAVTEAAVQGKRMESDAAKQTEKDTEKDTGKNTESMKETQSDTVGITEEDAIAEALRHAQVEESDVTAFRVKKEIDDGTEVYDVEFYAGDKEYDYEIKALDGTILSSDFEIEDDFRGSTAGSDTQISVDEAKQIALEKVPGASMIHIELDEDDGRLVYEGEIYHENKEYEFEIDASTGEIISWEQD